MLRSDGGAHSDRVCLCARRLGQFIVAAWQRAQDWMRQAGDFGIDSCLGPSFPRRFGPESPFLGLSGGFLRYYDRSTLLCWLDECYSIILDWHTFSRMLAFKIIDAIAAHLGANPPCYSVDEYMLGVVYIDNISYPKRCEELLRHGVPIFDITVYPEVHFSIACIRHPLQDQKPIST